MTISPSSGGERPGRLSADVGQRQPLRPPRSDEGGNVLLNLGAIASAGARAIDRLLRVDDEEYGVSRQSHGLQGRRGASAQ